MSEITQRAAFDYLRYAQVWEDADVLVEALNIQDDGLYLSIASAGDNAFAILAKNPKAVVALDLNPIQIHCVELRAKMYEYLDYAAFLELYGARPSTRRWALYQQCRDALSDQARSYWDGQKAAIDNGIASGGKFENYFKLFRTKVLPWVHSQKTIDALLQKKTRDQRVAFYDTKWNSWRWRIMFRLFFSKMMMGKHGRDKAFFKYVKGDLASNISARTQHALTELDPTKNAYLHWILKGHFNQALPLALREEHFDTIKANLHKLSWAQCSIEDYLAQNDDKIAGFNLSDIFEYMGEPQYHALLQRLIRASAPKARLVYWNMMVERTAPAAMHGQLRPLNTIAKKLHWQDKAFFYQKLIVEQVV